MKRRFRSFAKVNLGLEVVGKLRSGYHELKTVFATLSLHDMLEIAETKSGVFVRSDHEGVPDDESNLAHRAAVLMQKLARRKSGVSIRIRKRIPIGGGLGGGSSNAAAVLRGLDLMWKLNLGPAGLLEAASSLGADVPYFLFGGLALGLGRGDRIHPLDIELRGKVLLVSGPAGLSTAAVFRRFATRRAAPGKSRIDLFLGNPPTDRVFRQSVGTLRNDLERAALQESPPLAELARLVRQVARRREAVHATMSGSGSSYFLLFEDATALTRAALDLRTAGVKSRRCSFVSRRAYERRFEVPRPWTSLKP